MQVSQLCLPMIIFLCCEDIADIGLWDLAVPAKNTPTCFMYCFLNSGSHTHTHAHMHMHMQILYAFLIYRIHYYSVYALGSNSLIYCCNWCFLYKIRARKCPLLIVWVNNNKDNNMWICKVCSVIIQAECETPTRLSHGVNSLSLFLNELNARVVLYTTLRLIPQSYVHLSGSIIASHLAYTIRQLCTL